LIVNCDEALVLRVFVVIEGIVIDSTVTVSLILTEAVLLFDENFVNIVDGEALETVYLVVMDISDGYLLVANYF
jgi:hypothetical protein